MTHPAPVPHTNVTSGENLWRLDFSTVGERAAKGLLSLGVSFNGQISDGTLSQFCRNQTTWFQYALPRTVTFSPARLLIDEASTISIRSDEVLDALNALNMSSLTGGGWLEFPLNEASYGEGQGASAAPYAAKRLSSLWLKIGDRLVVECSMAPSMNLTCPIPSYDSSPSSFQFGNVSTALSFDGYHFAELAAPLALYRFNATTTSGEFASQFGGGEFGMLVTIEGGDLLNVSTIR